MTTPQNLAHRSWFSDWLSRAWPDVHALVFNEKLIKLLPFINLVGIVTGVSAYAVALHEESKNQEARFLFVVNDAGHLVLLAVVILFFFRRLGVGHDHQNRVERSAVSKAVTEFKFWLYALVFLWLLFYAARALADAPGLLSPTAVTVTSTIADSLNVVTALAFFALYMMAEYGGSSAWEAREHLWLPVVLVAAGVIIQIVARISHNDEYLLVGQIINGLIVGLATALLIGRMDSKYVGLHKGVIVTLYAYALIQPLFPYVFSNQSSSGIRHNLQAVLVAAALVMKTILLLSLGRMIDTGTLHFYISSMLWVDKHVGTLRRNHEKALTADESAEVEPYLFSLVPPDKPQARIRFEKEPDVRVQVGILNAWQGLSWEITEFSATGVQISEAKFKAGRVRIVGDTPRLVSEDNRFIKIELDLDLDVNSKELKEALRQDADIAHAISQDQKTRQTNVIVEGLKAYASIVDNGQSASHDWHRLESVDLTNRLFYSDTLDLERLG